LRSKPVHRGANVVHSAVAAERRLELHAPSPRLAIREPLCGRRACVARPARRPIGIAARPPFGQQKPAICAKNGPARGRGALISCKPFFYITGVSQGWAPDGLPREIW
jgi:hypothetical protein